ncbi:hypothetical protein HYE18_03940 [Mycoplasmopsis bovis]|nr:hypothetical protein [Mycoplasmopsis bovis]QQH25179.1 hypothetical protein HYE18_03940 [Mycoplasmopsis bovis]
MQELTHHIKSASELTSSIKVQELNSSTRCITKPGQGSRNITSQQGAVN